MDDKDRKELNEINRELMVSNEIYNDLVKNLARTGLRLWRLKKRIETLADEEKT